MTPDYENYSLDQLIDVRDHINKEAYPDRYELILSELEKRQALIAATTKDIIATAPPEKVETQFGLIVTRHTLHQLIVIKIFFALILIFFAALFYKGFMMQEVTSKGRLFTLSDSPLGYIFQMMIYGGLSLLSLWIATFGTKLKSQNEIEDIE